MFISSISSKIYVPPVAVSFEVCNSDKMIAYLKALSEKSNFGLNQQPIHQYLHTHQTYLNSYCFCVPANRAHVNKLDSIKFNYPHKQTETSTNSSCLIVIPCSQYVQ